MKTMVNDFIHSLPFRPLLLGFRCPGPRLVQNSSGKKISLIISGCPIYSAHSPTGSRLDR